MEWVTLGQTLYVLIIVYKFVGFKMLLYDLLKNYGILEKNRQK